MGWCLCGCGSDGGGKLVVGGEWVCVLQLCARAKPARSLGVISSAVTATCGGGILKPYGRLRDADERYHFSGQFSI